MIRSFFLRYFELFLIVLLLTFTFLPLMRSGFFSMHDNEQVGRLYELNNTLQAGEFPPRISQNLGFGYGYPFFNFYPSFVYYVAEVFKLVGFSYITSIELMIAFGYIFAAFAMYLLAKEYFGRIGATVAAIAYTYVPYHAAEVYVRGALAEFWTFVFLPLLFWGCANIAKTQNKKYVVYTTLFFAALVLTHNLIAMISAIFLFPFLCYLFFNTTKKKTFVLQMIFSFFVGFMLSAYFWIPSFFEKGTTMVDILTKEAGDYRQHFVYVRQFWNSAWGYGGSYPGIGDGMSFQIGQMHIVMAIITFFLLVYAYFKKRKILIVPGLFLFLFLFSLFLQTKYSKLLWESISLLWYMQFPWRFLIFSVLTSSFLFGVPFLFKYSQKLKLLLAGLIIFLLIVTTKEYFRPHTYFESLQDKDYVALEFIRWDTSKLAFEYVPKGIATKKDVYNNTVVAITKNDIAKNSYTVVKGDALVEVLEDKPSKKKFLVNVKNPAVLQINTYSFPGWKVFVDMKEVSYTDNNTLKLLTIPLAKGEYQVEAVFTDTFFRTLGNVLSLSAFALVILYIISPIILKPKKK